MNRAPNIQGQWQAGNASLKNAAQLSRHSETITRTVTLAFTCVIKKILIQRQLSSFDFSYLITKQQHGLQILIAKGAAPEFTADWSQSCSSL